MSEVSDHVSQKLIGYGSNSIERSERSENKIQL